MEKKFKEIRDGPKSILTETELWMEKAQEKMDTFQNSPNAIAFEMLEDRDSEDDIIRSGENLLDRLHATIQSPTPSVQNTASFLNTILAEYNVEFDEHFKNRITMLCHVKKLPEDEEISLMAKEEVPSKQEEKPVEEEKKEIVNLMDDNIDFLKDEIDLGLDFETRVRQMLDKEKETLNLTANNVTDDMVSELLGVLAEKEAHVKTLNLSGNLLSNSGVSELLAAVSESDGIFDSLETLDLSNNKGITQASERDFMDCLSNQTLQQIKLSEEAFKSSSLLENSRFVMV